jgi:hypothetical protein
VMFYSLGFLGWFCRGLWVSSCFWVFPPSPLSPVLVSSLYTSCMLRGAFYAFYKILYLLKIKNSSTFLQVSCT